MLFKDFSIFSSGGNSVQWNRAISVNLVKEHKRNISVKLFLNKAIALGGDVDERFFLVLDLAAILFSGEEAF